MKKLNHLGIKARLMWLVMLPVFVITAILTGFSIAKSIRVLNASLNDHGRIIATQLAPASEYGVLSGNINVLNAIIKQTSAQEDEIEAILITDQLGNKLIAKGITPLELISDNVNENTFRQFNHADYVISVAPIVRHYIEVDDFYDGTNNEKILASKQSQRIGNVYLTLSKNKIKSEKKSMILKSVLLGLLGFFLSAILAYRLGRSISNPIVSLAESVKTLGTGQLNLRVDEDAAGEIKTLQLGFNNMANHIQLAHDHLQDRVHDATRMLRHQAQHDSLTGLVNRQEFERRLSAALIDVKTNGAKHIFCYMDLDQFKVVNDTCGHHAGDELLRQISLILNQRVREEDTFARLGGDEFGLLLEHCETPNALSIAEEMRAMVEAFRFIHDNSMFKIGVSIGMVEITEDMPDLGAITSFADSACYAAKDNGRNRVHLFKHNDGELAKRHGEMQWVARINLAMDEERFCLYCQPIVPLQNNSGMMFYEVLLRKIDVNGTIILPMAFIPSAERFHLMAKIDQWVINKTFSIYHDLIDGNLNEDDFMLSINLSGNSLGDKNLLPFIKLQFERYSVPPNKICFEVTETSAIINLTNTIHLMQSLKAIGCKFLLDDFGSGMSSFAYLKNLPVDYLKMDGGFVKDITRNHVDLAMAKSIQQIAEAMQIKTIAEYVEDIETLQLLKNMGVNYGQGFYLGTPKPMETTLTHFKQLELIG